jgi:hypothetical protein
MNASIRTQSLALVGAVALAFTGSSAKATLTYTYGDLFLGFRDSSGTASQDYLVDIGQASQFTPSGSSFTVVSGLGADLATAFGSDWATNGNIHWSIYGTTYDGTNSPVLYATNQEPTVGTQSDAWLGRSVSAQKTTINGAFNTATLYYTDNGTATANEPKGTFQTASATGSYNSFFQYPSGKDFNVWTTIEGDFTNGTSGSVLDLYKIDPVNGVASTYEGSFSLSSSGTLSYSPTVAAVPEPSVVGLLGVVAMLVPVLLRNRRRSADSLIPSNN